MNKDYTVLLQLPSDIADGSEPWEDTFQEHVRASTAPVAVDIARDHAVEKLEYEGDPEDFAVLALHEGHLEDLYDSEVRRAYDLS